jgi:hypothetical protein
LSALARIVAAAAIYFVLVMSAGFLLGTIRELLLVPKFGRTVGEPLEAPFMLVAILLSAWVTLRWFPLEPTTSVRFAMGGISLVMVLLTELALSPFVRGSVQAWFDSFTTLTLGLSIVLWIAHVVAPVLVRR